MDDCGTNMSSSQIIEEGMEEMVDFMMQNGIDDKTISVIKSQKIGPSIVASMPDADLEKFIPLYGDRLKLKQHCQRYSVSKKKRKLIRDVVKKIKKNRKDETSSSEEEESRKKSHGNLKNTRQIEIGWMCCFDGTRYQQVRTTSGGGTRKAQQVFKTYKKKDILRVATEYFFPNGSSKQGPHDAFYEIDLWDYKCCILNDSLTIERLFKVSGLAVLRFYLATKLKAPIKNKRLSKEKLQNPQSLLPNLGEGPSSLSAANIFPTGEEERSSTSGYVSHIKSVSISRGENDPQNSQSLLLDLGEGSSSLSPANVFITEEEERPSTSGNVSHINSMSITRGENDSVTLDYFESSLECNEETIVLSPCDNTTTTSYEAARDPLGEFLVWPLPEEHFTNDASTEQFPPTSHTEPLYIHRGHVFKELVDVFMTHKIPKNGESLVIKMILPNGIEEIAVDEGGVLRDTLSEFWTDFFEQCTLGSLSKVPQLRHDYKEEKWRAIATILYRSWKDANYYPLELCQSFMEMCILRSMNTDLLQAFLHYVSDTEARILKRALSPQQQFDENSTSEILEVLQEYDCKVLINKNNFESVLRDIAHKELIQKPMYIIDIWQQVLHGLMTHNELNNIYEKNKILPKNVLSLLVHQEPLTTQESRVFNYVKKFVKDSDTKTLKLFLRFCTGADVITNKNINVTFNDNVNCMQVPRAHTCTCNFEVSRCYDNYIIFKSDFNKILNSNYWIMDFV